MKLTALSLLIIVSSAVSAQQSSKNAKKEKDKNNSYWKNPIYPAIMKPVHLLNGCWLSETETIYNAKL